MAKLKNMVACLITLTMPSTVTKDKDGKVLDIKPGATFDLLPAGPAVEVPLDKLPSGQRDWVEHLIDSGQVAAIGGDTDIYAAMSREELEATASGLGVKFTENTTDAQLLKAVRAKS